MNNPVITHIEQGSAKKGSTLLKQYMWDAMLVLLIVLESCFMLYFYRSGKLPIHINEIGFTITSILIGLVVILKYYNCKVRYIGVKDTRNSFFSLLPYLLLVGGIVVFSISIASIFRETPIERNGSDIIPTIQVAVERLLNGETVYTTIDKWGYELPLTYLPMQWMPYTFADLLHFDFRWIAAVILFIASIAVVFRSTKVSAGRGAITSMLLLYSGWMILKHDTGILHATVEIMVAGYYMLLITGLGGKNPWWRGAAIAICLLSRYSLVLWLPLWALVEFMEGNRKDFFRSCIVIILLIAGLYIIPFLMHDWGAFGRGYHYYSKAAIGEWGNIDGNGVPFQLDQGLGFARLFYQKLSEYPVPDRLAMLQKVHLLASLGSVALMGVWYWLCRRHINYRIFLLASFKIYLSIFLAFIQVPYTYLMITAPFVSIAIFAELCRYRKVDTPILTSTA